MRLPVVGFEGRYEVSDTGDVFNAKTGFKRKARPTRRGYLQVILTDAVSRQYSRHIHSLVAEAFIGPRPAGLQVNHVDHDKLNNEASNLEYVTGAENVRAWQKHKDPTWEPTPKKEPEPPAPRPPRPVVAFHEVTKHEVSFSDIQEAVDMGFTDAGITWCLAGRLKTHKGYSFKAVA